MQAGSGCFRASYLVQGGNWWPLEFAFHRVGQSSTRSSESQPAVHRQCRSRADWEVRYGTLRQSPRHPYNVPCFSNFTYFWSLCVL